MFSYPPVVDKVCSQHSENDNVLKCYTEEGLRANIHYMPEEHPEYTIYVSGDRDYAIASFAVFITAVKGEKPIINEALYQSKLTYSPDV